MINWIEILLWVSAAGLSLLVPVIIALYWNRELAVRRSEIKACIARYRLDRFYVQLPSIPGNNTTQTGGAEAAIDSYFESRFSQADYLWPSLMFFFVAAVGFCGSTLWILNQLNKANLPHFQDALLLSSPVCPAFLGSYLFCLLETVHRYKRFDLLPATILSLTFNLIAGAVLGIVLAPLFSESLLPTMSAAIGLSIPVGLESLKQKLADNLGVRRDPEQESDLKILFPCNAKAVSRLTEEGIETISNLAQSDPLRLYLVLPYELRIILNWVDRALLLSYFPTKADVLRDKFQILGIIEYASIVVFFKGEEDPEDLVSKDQAVALIDQLAQALETSPTAIRNSLDTLVTDPQVSKIWDMYGAIFEQA
jgi:hypothetical protein